LTDLDSLSLEGNPRGPFVIDTTKFPKLLRTLKIKCLGYGANLQLNLEHEKLENLEIYYPGEIDINFDKCPKLVSFHCRKKVGKLICSQERFFKDFTIGEKIPQDDDWKNITIYRNGVFTSAFFDERRTFKSFPEDPDEEINDAFYDKLRDDVNFIILKNQKIHPSIHHGKITKINLRYTRDDIIEYFQNLKTLILDKNGFDYSKLNPNIQLILGGNCFFKYRTIFRNFSNISSKFNSFYVKDKVINSFMNFIDDHPEIVNFTVKCGGVFHDLWLQKFNKVSMDGNHLHYFTRKPHPGVVIEHNNGVIVSEPINHLEICYSQDVEINAPVKNLIIYHCYVKNLPPKIHNIWIMGSFTTEDSFTLRIGSETKKIHIETPKNYLYVRKLIIDSGDDKVVLDSFYAKNYEFVGKYPVEFAKK
jgi:hypothetical protein